MNPIIHPDGLHLLLLFFLLLILLPRLLLLLLLLPRYTYILPPIPYPDGRTYLKLGAHDLTRKLQTGIRPFTSKDFFLSIF